MKYSNRFLNSKEMPVETVVSDLASYDSACMRRSSKEGSLSVLCRR